MVESALESTITGVCVAGIRAAVAHQVARPHPADGGGEAEDEGTGVGADDTLGLICEWVDPAVEPRITPEGRTLVYW